MKMDILLGLQWGDEGKGKIVDVLTPRYDVIARFQGGPNAGHSLEFNGIRHVLHIIPSGIFHKEKTNIIGNGVVIDPIIFEEEINALIAMGLTPTDNLFISRKAHLILPTHKLLDAAQEAHKGNMKIGSTLKGIGPTYTDKTARTGLRVCDLESPDFETKYRQKIDEHIEILQNFHFDYEAKLAELDAQWRKSLETIRKFQFIDSEYVVHHYLTEEKSVLAEGAQGTLLDVEFGAYPFVTSSNTIAAGAFTGLGLAPHYAGRVFGIVKAYCTRVGSGPFPTELFDETGEFLRKEGNEYGATTGRPRRCGWLDLVALQYALMISASPTSRSPKPTCSTNSMKSRSARPTASTANSPIGCPPPPMWRLSRSIPPCPAGRPPSRAAKPTRNFRKRSRTTSNSLRIRRIRRFLSCP